MQFSQLGRSGLRLPALGFGTATFGGGTEFFRKWGATDTTEAERLLSRCFEVGAAFFDTADVYSGGASEEILGQALGKRRGEAILATKVGYRTGPGPNSAGASRQHILSAVDASLRRLKTDYVDLLHLHGFDEFTPVEETLHALDSLITAGKVRYFGGSNYSAWHMMKMAAAADQAGLPRPVSHQVYYSLLAREYEHELMPLGADQGIGGIVWSPLSGGRLSGKVRRGQTAPEESRAAQMCLPSDDRLFDIVDALAVIAEHRNRSISQVAIAWLLHRPTVSCVLIGARSEAQLADNLAAVDLTLSTEELATLESVSAVPPPYPYGHQRNFPELVKPLPTHIRRDAR